MTEHQLLKWIINLIGLTAIVVVVLLILNNGKLFNKETDAIPTLDTIPSKPPVKKPKAIEVLNFNETNSMGFTTIHVQVRNNTNKYASFAIQANFYDKKNNVVGTGYGGTANLAPGQRRVVDVMATDVERSIEYDVDVLNVTLRD